MFATRGRVPLWWRIFHPATLIVELLKVYTVPLVMPIDYILSLVLDGPENTAGWSLIKKYGPPLAVAGAAKWYFGGTPNTFDRDVNGKVYLITGGTLGLGAQIAYELAVKGAQIVFLVRLLTDLWTVEFIDDLRQRASNFMIYAEECDLADLHSVRLFATKWLDNQPPRRLDGVVCCAAECIPYGSDRQSTANGIERQLGVNYVGHYHLLTLLAPALRVQPPDRDVRIVVATCATHLIGSVVLDDLWYQKRPYPKRLPWQVYGTSKLYLGLFAQEFQRQLDNYERKDKTPCNVRINMANPGIMRSALTRRFISVGTIWGLFLYLLLYPIWWFFFKLASQGAQLFMFALWAPFLRQIPGGQLIQECKVVTEKRSEYDNENLQKKLFDLTAKHIEELEKAAAVERNRANKNGKKKPQTDLAQKPASEAELMDKIDQIRALLNMGASQSKTTKDDPLPLFPLDAELVEAVGGKGTPRKRK